MKKFLIIPLAIILVVALIFGGCGKPAEEAPEEIRFGDSACLTGMFSGFARGGTFGFNTAIEDINSLGGVYVEEYGKKLPVTLISYDNESDPIKGATLAEDLILSEDIHMLVQCIGPQTITATISPIADRYEIPYVGLAGPMEPFKTMRATVTPSWPYSWCIAFSIATPYPPGSFWDKPGMTMADMALEWLKVIAPHTNLRAGAFATDDPNGRGWFALFPGILEDAGYTVSGREEELGLFPFGTTDFSAMIGEWIDDDCDVIIGNAPGVDCGVLLRQCRERGFKPKAVWAGQGAIFYENIIAWGGDIPNGACTDRWWYPTFDPNVCVGIAGRTPQSLADYWDEKTGEPLNPGIGLGYAMAQVMFDSVERAGTLDGPTVNRAIGETDLPTMLYHFRFDDEQFAGYPMFLAQWQKTDEPWIWECPIVFTPQPHMGEPVELQFPIPYD